MQNGNVNDATTFGVSSETDKLGMGSVPVTITELGPNSGVFGTYDESDVSVIKITSDAARGTSATFDYNDSSVSVLVSYGWGSVDIQPVDDEWNSGEEIPVIIIDTDFNKNSRADEDLVLNDPNVTFIPALSTGNPFTLGESGQEEDTANGVFDSIDLVIDCAELQVAFYSGTIGASAAVGTTATGLALAADSKVSNGTNNSPVQCFSERMMITAPITTGTIADAGSNTIFNASNVAAVLIDLEVTMEELQATINDPASSFTGFNLFNYDVRSFGPANGAVDIFLVNSTIAILDKDNEQFDTPTGTYTTSLVESGDGQGYGSITGTTGGNPDAALFDAASTPSAQNLGLLIQFSPAVTVPTATSPIVADFFSFGFSGDGVQASERTANQIIRIEAEESGDNTSTFEGSLEYIMVNQLNISVESTYLGLSTIASDPSFIVIEDLTDEDSPRVTIVDRGADGVFAFISDQEAAPSHSGVVSFNADSYKQADTVEITLEDLDLNTDSSLIDIYTTVETDANSDGSDNDQVGIDVSKT